MSVLQSLTQNKDAYLRNQVGFTTTNYGSVDTLVVTLSSGKAVADKRALFSFPLFRVGAAAVESATFNYRVLGVSAGMSDVVIVRSTQDFVEGEVTWDEYSSGNAWSVAGGDIDATTSISALMGSGDQSVDVTSLMIEAINAEDSSLKLCMYKNANADSRFMNIASKEHATSAYRPTLDVTYAPKKTKRSGTVRLFL